MLCRFAKLVGLEVDDSERVTKWLAVGVSISVLFLNRPKQQEANARNPYRNSPFYLPLTRAAIPQTE